MYSGGRRVSPVVAERLVVGAQHRPGVRPVAHRPDLDPRRQGHLRDRLERRPEHEEEPADRRVAFGGEERARPGGAVVGPGLEPPGSTADGGERLGRERCLVGPEDRPSHAPPANGRGEVAAVREDRVARRLLHPPPARRVADARAVELDDGDVARRVDARVGAELVAEDLPGRRLVEPVGEERRVARLGHRAEVAGVPPRPDLETRDRRQRRATHRARLRRRPLAHRPHSPRLAFERAAPALPIAAQRFFSARRAPASISSAR